jgi:alpha-tubulin suppressor-like RCC1 family protein
MRARGRAWGSGEYGKLGLGDTSKRTSPARLAADAFGGLQVLQAACGDDHTLAVTEEGGLWTWGAGGYGRLGHGNHNHAYLPARVDSHYFAGQRISMVAAGTNSQKHFLQSLSTVRTVSLYTRRV